MGVSDSHGSEPPYTPSERRLAAELAKQSKAIYGDPEYETWALLLERARRSLKALDAATAKEFWRQVRTIHPYRN